jgi:CRP/FNR family transcriptional regulator, cyclic AMP receptor protein
MAVQLMVDVDRTPFLERMPPSSRDQILANSTKIRYRAGTIAFQPDDPDRAEILVSGFARSYLTSAEGRQVTVRYVHPGELMGGVLIMHAGFDGSVQLVTDSNTIRLDVATVRRRVDADPAVASALAGDLALRYSHTVRRVALHVFGTVVQRVAFDLLERATRTQISTGMLQANVSHQEIADGIGSVRQVVTRALAELRKRGLIEVTHRVVRISDPAALEVIAFAPLA